ncbi:MAG: Dabb family protein [Parafilimonas sp.]
MKKIVNCVLFMFIITNIAMSQTSQKMLRHVVLFGWKAGADSAAINKVVEGFKELPKKISSIKQFEWGMNNSPENLNQGLTHCFLVTFSSEKDRDAYLVDPAHKAFVAKLQPLLDKVTVVDYWAEE